MGPTQQIPTATGRVTVDPRCPRQVGDARRPLLRQCPPAHIRNRRHPGQTCRSLAQGSRRHQHLAHDWQLRKRLRRPTPGRNLPHGQRSASSVVNRNCQIHDVDNVFVIDGSVHVTNGGFNPVAHHHGRRLLRIGIARSATGKAQRSAHDATTSNSLDSLSRPSSLCLSCRFTVRRITTPRSTARDAPVATRWLHTRRRCTPLRIAMQRAWTATTPASPPSCVTSGSISFGQPPESIRLRDVDVLAMTTKCQSCHQHEYASWHAGPHSVTYAQIFTDPTHNSKRRLMDDCLRCHGMHFNGSIRDLVQPQNTTGPWQLKRASLTNEPTIPCMACHQLHREGATQPSHQRGSPLRPRRSATPSPSSTVASNCTSPQPCLRFRSSGTDRAP